MPPVPPAIWIACPFTLRATSEQSQSAVAVTSSVANSRLCRLPRAR
jgi:hypothetical protein